MKSLYLILATTAVVVTCKPQHSNNDIIWYPIEGEDGVFISTLGEKHRSSENGKYRSHRRARYSGMPLPLSFDPTKNQDSSFFHNINERRTASPIPKVPPSFQSQEFQVSQVYNRPQGQGNQNLYDINYQEILNGIFDYNKNPYPGTNSQWGDLPDVSSLWEIPLKPQNNNQWGISSQRPGVGNQWNDNSGSLISGSSGQRPATSNQWSGNNNFRPGGNPSNSEWIVSESSSNRPNRPNNNKKPNRPNNQSDKLVFPEDTTTLKTTTTSDFGPSEKPTMSPCERTCPVTPEYNPVCGSDGVTYNNAGRLKCSQMCGNNVKLSHYGNCGKSPLVTPLVSNRPKQKFGEFWIF